MTGAVWRHDFAFWLLWLLPAVVALAVRAHRSTRKAALQFSGRVMTPRLLPPLGWSGPLRKTALLVGGLALAILAAARPAWDVYYLTTAARGLDLVVALDVSRSMLADDGSDSRLGRARSAALWLVRQLGGDRVGLLLFAGQSTEACPLTLDRGFFESSLARASPDSVGRGGTKIGPALEASLRMLDTSWDRDKLVLLVTDGGDQESFPRTAAKKLRQKKIRVITLGLGRADAGAPLVLQGKIVRRKDGQPVLARLNDKLLKELAVETQGMYVPPEEAHRLPELYAEHFASLRRGKNEELQEKHYREKFQWFLLAAFVLLLLQAGRSPYRRSRSRPGRAAAALWLCALALLPACGGEPGRLRQGIDRLASGDAAAAEKRFLELSGELPDEPVLAYDLACAHQALGRLRQARARYVEVLEKGDKRLRARARTNLAMLGVARLEALVGDEAGRVSQADRAELRGLAEAALDELQRARELDPRLAEARRRQDLLARWLRVVENGWREKDRAAEREKRAKLKGPAFLEALIHAEEQIRAALAGGELLEDLELRQRDLLEDVPRIKDHFGDKGAELAAAFREEGARAVAALVPLMEKIAGLLRGARITAALHSISSASGKLIDLWMLWTDPGAGLGRAAQAQAGFVQELEQRAAARLAGRRPVPRKPEERVLVAEKEREALAQREGQILSWVGKLRRRVAADSSSAEWSPIFLRRARDKLPGIEASLGKALGKLAAQGPQSLVQARRALQALQGLALEWRLAGLEPVPLARRLELEQARLLRSADALRGGAEQAHDDILARLGGLAKGLLRSLAWVPIRARQADQADRVAYLGAALERLLQAPKDADEEARKQLDLRRAALQRQLGRVREAMDRAVEALASATDEAALASMHDARLRVRELWSALAGFEPLLAAAAREQAALQQRSQATAAAEPANDPDGAARSMAYERRDALREQRVTAQLAQRLGQALGHERQRSRAARDALQAGASEQGNAVAREELEARLAVLGSLGDLLPPAAQAAARAAGVLAAEAGGFDKLRQSFRKAAALQQRAAELLAKALQRLEAARLPLQELAKRITEGEERLLRAARELAAGRAPEGPDGKALDWQKLGEAQEGAGAYVERLAPALERELARLRQAKTPAQPPAKSPPEPATESKEERALRSLVEGVASRHADSLRAFASKEGKRIRDSVAATLDASRILWASITGFRELLEKAAAQEGELLGRSAELARAAPEPAEDRVAAAAEDQGRTAELLPPLRQRVAAMKRAAKPPTAAPTKAPKQGAPPPAGLPPELLELAEQKLPAAQDAMAKAREHLESSALNDAQDRQEEAKRLLEEILDKLKQPEQDQQDAGGQARGSRQLSPAELQRLLEAVRERNKRKQERSKRTPVEEDW